MACSVPGVKGIRWNIIVTLKQRITSRSRRVGLPQSTVWAMSAACGISVANIYYNQPLLFYMGDSFHATQRQIGYLPGISQAGVAIGMFAFVPLGDMLPRRLLIVWVAVACAFAAVFTATAGTLKLLYFAGFLTGVTNIVPHLILPLAAKLAAPERRGRVLGHVLGGLLSGILLARVVSGLVATAFGWRAMYWGAAALMLSLSVAMRFVLPEELPDDDLPERGVRYGALLRSIAELVRTQPILREASLEGAMLFGAFSSFWSTLVFLLATPPYHYGSSVAGLFGVVGLAGAFVAPVAGRLSDRKGPGYTVALGIGISLLSYLIFGLFGYKFWGLVLGVLLLDVGVQGGHVANQTRIYALVPEARSRLNTVYMVSYFLGGSLGSVLGAYGWQRAGWSGVCAAGGVQLSVAAAVRWARRNRW